MNISCFSTRRAPGLLLSALVAAAAVVVGCADPGAESGSSNSTRGAALSIGTVQALTDINQVVSTTINSNPSKFFVFGGVAYFAATEPSVGAELWRTDGTPAGTWLVTDLNPGTNSALPDDFTLFDGRFFLTATDGVRGNELWTTDGTAAGTVLFADLNPGSASSNPTNLTLHGGKLYFTATNGSAGTELWVTDGTVAGTEMITDIYPGSSSSSPGNLTSFGGYLFFTATTGTTAPGTGTELYRTDGTAAGTVMVADLNPGTGSAAPSNFIVYDNYLYFSATNGTAAGANGSELFRTDGTTISLVMDIWPGTSSSSPSNLTLFNGELYFSATTGTTSPNTGRELWKHDGTTTSLVVDLNPGTGSSSPTNLTVWNGELYFAASEGTVAPAVGIELYKTDGTAAGTVLVHDILAGTASSSPNNFIVFGNSLYFSAFSASTAPGTGRELWKTDGTSAGTVEVADLNPGTASSTPTEMRQFGSVLLVNATDGVVGNELFAFDGTGFTLVKDIYGPTNGSAIPQDPFAYGNLLLFSAIDGVNGRELWRTDGTVGGTFLLRDIYPGTTNSTPNELTLHDGKVYFTANDATTTVGPGRELWVTDGTVAGTQMVLDLAPGTSSGLSLTNAYLTSWNGLLYFAGSNGTAAAAGGMGTELWATDGTAAGTQVVADIWTGTSSSAPQHLTPMGAELFFSATTGTTAPNTGRELWKTDGTFAGTVLLKDINVGTGNSSPNNLTVIGSQLFFTATEGTTSGIELWVSDGTGPGTVMLKDINPGATGSSPAQLTVLGQSLFLVANDGTHGAELWSSDGTAAGTVMVKDINPGGTGAGISLIRVVGSKLFFVADDGSNGSELWVSDGTGPGTVMVKDIGPLDTGAGIASPTVVGSKLFFIADDGVVGPELWVSDGTATGTTLVKDIMPGPRGASLRTLTAFGDKLLFSADDGVHGSEPWISDGTAAGTFRVADLNPGAVSSAPDFFFQLGDKIYVSAVTSATQRELFTMQVIDDIAPVVLCPGALTHASPTSSGAVVTFTVTATDDLDPNPTLTVIPPSGSTFALGSTTVQASATDASGNTGTCSFVVTVIQDVTAPQVTCPASVSEVSNGPGGLTVSFAAATATDDKDPAPEVSYSHASGSSFPVGPTTVTVTATDWAGNSATCTFTVTVSFVDITPPVLSCPQSVAQVSNDVAGTTVSWADATATDDSGVAPTLAYSPAKGSLFPVGQTQVTVTATDGAGNASTCTFPVNVTFVDITAPTIVCPADIANTTALLEGETVTWADATATDDSGVAPSVAYSPQRGSLFPVGSTTVTATATDAANNSASCTFEVTITFVDSTPPVVTCPDSATLVSNDAGGRIVDYPAATATDDATAAPTIVYSKASGTLFPVGPTVVTATARDEADNASTCDFTITVSFEDITPPVLACPGPGSAVATADAGIEVTYPAATVTDDSGLPPTLTYDLESGALFPVGQTVVTATATDAAGNQATCSFPITVTLEDSPDAKTGSGCGCGATGSDPVPAVLGLLMFLGYAARRRYA